MSAPSIRVRRWTVGDDGVVWMQEGVRIPLHVLKKSQTLMDALLSEADSVIAGEFTLAAPTEWLQAWVACFCSEEQHLSCAETFELVNCLMVCSCFWLVASIARNRFILCLRRCDDYCHLNATLDTPIQLASAIRFIPGLAS
jgi:hypothetical protein